MSDNAVAEWRNSVSNATNMLVQAAGSVTAILLAVLFVAGYLWWGAANGFTQRWFEILHSVTGIVAFVMVFLIRHAEGRESRAALAKLDELIAATTGASDALVGLERTELEKQEELEEEAPVGRGSAEPTS